MAIEKNKPNVRFLQFPLFLLRELLIDKSNTIDKIFKYGIYQYSTHFHYQIEEVAKQLIYANYRGKLTKDLSNLMKMFSLKCGLIGGFEYDLFGGNGEFTPEIEEINEVLILLNEDLKFRESAIEFYQIKLSYESLRLSGCIDSTLKTALKIKSIIPKNEPMPMVNVERLFEFRDKHKTEYEFIQFVAFIAIKSIIGIKPFVKTNKKHIVSRMFGYSSIKQIPDAMQPEIKLLFDKFMIRYHIDKLLLDLELNWNLITYSNNMRGMYISIDNKTKLIDLAKIAESSKRKNKIAELNKLKKEAKENAINHLNLKKGIREGYPN